MDCQPDGKCPLCSGDVPPELVAQIKAASERMSAPMSVEEFKQWLDGLDP